MIFRDRTEAGRRLAPELVALAGPRAVVLGLPRGGVPVAFEVARALRVPLDVIVVRKLGLPGQPELAMGAMGEDGAVVLNHALVEQARVSKAQLAEVEASERRELERRVRRYRGDRPRLDLRGRTAIIVDDGIATGATATAACHVARAHGAARVVLAAPVASPEAVRDLARHADAVVALETPADFRAVGAWYRDFGATSDDEVARLLRAGAGPEPAPEAQEVRIGAHRLGATLVVPDGASGIVAFAHGSGSSRRSPRNQAVAAVLQEAGIATLLLDLLTPAEEGDRRNVFDIDLLATRLLDATRWIGDDLDRSLAIGYFGASTGAAAALRAAAAMGPGIAAVVSRGGRPDLAAAHLAAVRAPTLLLVGERDPEVLALNRQALAALRCERRLVVVPGATHLFEEPGTLGAVARLARDWFTDHLVRVDPSHRSRLVGSPPAPAT